MTNSNIKLSPIIIKHFSTGIASFKKCYINLFIIISSGRLCQFSEHLELNHLVA